MEDRRSNDTLNAPSPASLVPDAPPAELRATQLGAGDGRVVVFSYPAGSSESALFLRLTAAERGVLELLLEGKTNARIGQARGTTLRTVSKQVDAVFKKLEVHSRAELAARFGPASEK